MDTNTFTVIGDFVFILSIIGGYKRLTFHIQHYLGLYSHCKFNKNSEA